MNPYESPEPVPDEYPGKTLSDVLLFLGLEAFWVMVIGVAIIFIAIIHAYVIGYLGLVLLSNQVGHRLFPQHIRYETWRSLEEDTPKLVLFAWIAWTCVFVEWGLILAHHLVKLV